MGLADAFRELGPRPALDADRSTKKRYSELLSQHLARAVAAELREMGFDGCLPMPDGPSEKQFEGGLGSKKVDVSLSDDAHGLLLGVSIKSINFPPFRKNLRNRAGDLCTECITLHMRFPYAVVVGLFVMPAEAAENGASPSGRGRGRHSTMEAACRVFRGLSGRADPDGSMEKFEHFALLLYEPGGRNAWLMEPATAAEVEWDTFWGQVRETFLSRNPHWIDKL